jgi:hypothetical protein
MTNFRSQLLWLHRCPPGKSEEQQHKTQIILSLYYSYSKNTFPATNVAFQRLTMKWCSREKILVKVRTLIMSSGCFRTERGETMRKFWKKFGFEDSRTAVDIGDCCFYCIKDWVGEVLRGVVSWGRVLWCSQGKLKDPLDRLFWRSTRLLPVPFLESLRMFKDHISKDL